MQRVTFVTCYCNALLFGVTSPVTRYYLVFARSNVVSNYFLQKLVTQVTRYFFPTYYFEITRFCIYISDFSILCIRILIYPVANKGTCSFTVY